MYTVRPAFPSPTSSSLVVVGVARAPQVVAVLADIALISAEKTQAVAHPPRLHLLRRCQQIILSPLAVAAAAQRPTPQRAPMGKTQFSVRLPAQAAAEAAHILVQVETIPARLVDLVAVALFLRLAVLEPLIKATLAVLAHRPPTTALVAAALGLLAQMQQQSQRPAALASPRQSLALRSPVVAAAVVAATRQGLAALVVAALAGLGLQTAQQGSPTRAAAAVALGLMVAGMGQQAAPASSS